MRTYVEKEFRLSLDSISLEDTPIFIEKVKKVHLVQPAEAQNNTRPKMFSKLNMLACVSYKSAFFNKKFNITLL